MATEANIPEDVSEKNTGLEERYSMKAQFDSIPNECSPAESIKPSSGLNEYPQCFECSAEAVNKEAVDNVGDKITIVVISSTKSPEDRSSVVSSSSDKSLTEHIHKSGLCQVDNIMNQALTQISENERQHQKGVQLQSKDVETGGDKVEAINDKNIQEHDGAKISGLGRAEEPNLKVHEEETSMDNSSLDQHLELIADQHASFKVIPESIEKEVITSQTIENPRSKGEDAALECNEQATSIFETNLGLINETLLPNLELTTKCQGAEDKRVIESCIKDEDIDSTIHVEDEFKEISFTGVHNKKPEMQSVLEGELMDTESIWSSDNLEHDNNREFKLMHGSTEDASTVNVAQSPYDHSIEEFTFEAGPKNEDNDDDKLENPCSNLVTNGPSTQVAIEAGETLQEASYTTCKDKNKDIYESVVPPVDRMAKTEDSACLDTEVRGANEEDSTQTELTETNENSKVNPEKHDAEKRDSLQKNEQEELGEQIILNPEMTEIAAPRENAEKRVEQNIHTVEIFEEKDKDGPTSTTDSVETSFSTEKGLPLVESITKIKSEESIFPLMIADDLNSKYPWVEETGQSDSSETGEVSKTEVQEKNKESSKFCVENNKQDKHHSEIQSLENLFIKHMDSEAMVTTKTIAKSTKDTEELEKVSETHSEEKIEIKGNGKIIQEEPKEREEATDKQLHNTEKESVSEDEAPSRLPTMASIRDETIEQSFQEESLKDGESTSIYKNKSQRPENDDNKALEVCERSKTEASISKPEEEIENTVGTLSSASVGMKTEKAYLVEDESEETKMKQEVKVTESKGQIEATHLIERKISDTYGFSEPKEEHVALTTEENNNNFNKYPSSVLEEFEKGNGSTNDSKTEFLAVASENTVMKEVKQVNEEQFEGSDAAQEMMDVTKSNGLGSIDIAERQEEENNREESRDMEVGDNILKVCELSETEASVSKPKEEEIENTIRTLSSSSVGTKTGKEHPQYESEETKTKEEVDVTESKGQNEATHLVKRNISNNLDDFSESKEEHGASTTEEKNNILVKDPSSILGEFEKDSGSNNDSESEFLRVMGENTPVKEVKPVNEEQLEGSDAPQEMVDVTTIETKSNDLSSVDIAERKKEETISEESKNMEVGDNILEVCEPSETGASISKPEDEEIKNTFGTLSSSSIGTKTRKKYVEEDESEETKTKEEVEVTESKGQKEATHLIERNISNNLDDFTELKEEHSASTTEDQLEGSDAAQDMMDVTTIEKKSNYLSNVYIAERQEEETNSEESTNKEVGDNILKACEPSESEASVSKLEDKEIENTIGTLFSSSVGMKTGKEYVEEDESEETKMKEEVEVTKSRGQNEATHLEERNIHDTLDDFSEPKEEHGASTTKENNNILVKDPSSILGEFEKDSDSNNDSECGFLGVMGETTTMKEVKPVNEEQLEGSDATQEMMGITIETKSNILSRVDIAKRQEEETNSKDSKNMEVGDNILKVCEPSETVASFSKPEDEEIENTVGTLSSSLVGMKTAKDYKEEDESEETKMKEEVEVTESKGQNEATHLVERNISNTLDDFSETKEEHGASSTEENNNNIFKEPSSILGEFEKDSDSNNDSKSEFLIIVGENTPVKEVKPINEVQFEGSDAAQEMMYVTTIETKSHDLSSGDIAETRKEETNENSKVMDMEVGDNTLKVCESLETEASASKPEYEEIENTVGTLPSSSVGTKIGKEYMEEDESEETKNKEEVEVTESKGQNEATHLIERNIYITLDDFSEPKEEYGASTTEEQLEGFDAAQETIHITTIETKSNCLSNVYIDERQEEETNLEESTNKEVGDNILKACEPSESEAFVSKLEDEEIDLSVGMKMVKEYIEDESEETKTKEEVEVTESKGQNEATHLVERNISNTLDDFSEPKEEHGASTTEEKNNNILKEPSSTLGELEKDSGNTSYSKSEFLRVEGGNTAMEVKPVNEVQLEVSDAAQDMMDVTTNETKSNSLSSVDIAERQAEETYLEENRDMEVGEMVDQGEQMSHDIKDKDLIMGINHETELTITGDQLVHTFTDSSMILSKKGPTTIDMSKATEKRHKDGDQPMRSDLKTENNISDSDGEDIEKGKREQVDCLADLNEVCKLEIVEEEKSAIEVTKHIEVYTYMDSRKALLQEENLAGKTEDNSGVIGVEIEAAELKAASPRSEEESANIKTSKLLMEKGAFVSVARDQSEDTLLHSSNNQTEGKGNNIQEKDSQSVQYIMRLKFQGDTDPNMKPRCNDEDHLNLTLDQAENTNAIEFTHQVHQKSRTADNDENTKEHLTKGRITSPGEETRNEVKVSSTEFTERVRSTELTEGKKSITSENQTEQNMDITEFSAFKSTEASETYTEVSSSTSKGYATETEAEVIQKDDPATDDPKNVPVIIETEQTGLKNAGPEHVEYNKGSDIAIKNNGKTAIATNKTTLDSTDIIEREEENFNPERKGILEELNEGNLKMDLEETDKTSPRQLDIELATSSIPMFQDYTELSIGEKEAVGTATNYPIDERSTREDIAAETAETYLLVHTTENKLLQKEHEVAKPGGVSELESVDITKEFSNEDSPKLENEGLHMVFDQNTNNSISDTSSISYHDASSKFDTEKEEKLFVEASKCTPSNTHKDSEAIQGQENLASTFEGNTCVKIEKAATELETKDFSHEDKPIDEFPSEKTVEAADANEKVGLTSESMAKDQSDEKIYQAKEKSDSEDEIIEPREYISGKKLQGESHREIDMQFEVEHHISVPRNEHETSVAGDCTVNVLKETEEVKGRENIPEYTQDPKSNLKEPDALYAGDKTVNEVKATNTGFIEQTEKFNKEDDNNTFETLPCTSERKDVTTIDKVQSSLDTIDTDNTKGESSNSEDSRDKQSPEIFDEGGREMNQDTRAPTTEVEHEKEENTSLTSISKDNLQKPSVMQTEEDDPLKNKFSNAIGNLANDGQTYKNTETAFVADTAAEKPPQSNHDAIKPTVFPELGNSIIEKENANKEIQKLEDGNLHDQNSQGTISYTKDVKISIMEKGSGVTDQNGAGTPEDMENPKLCNEGSKYTVNVTSTNNEQETENFTDTLKIIVAEKIATESDLSGQSNLHESNKNEKSELPAEILEPINLGKKFESASDSKVHDETNEQLPQTREKSNNIRDCISEHVEQFPETKFESEKQRNLDPQMEAEHILNILRHAKETSVTSLTAKEVHDGVDRTGGSENIEEQIIKAEVSSMGLQMLSARDETVNQMKDHNLISTKDLKITDSSKHTAMAGLNIEDDPIRKEASSAIEASEEIMHDKGDWRPIDDPKAEIKIEKKIETGENCINMTETTPVEVQKVEASTGEAQLDNKPLEGFNLNKQCPETIKIRPGLQTEEDIGMEVEMNSHNLFAQLPHTAHVNAGRKIPFPEIVSKEVELKDEDIDLSEQTLAEENLSLDGNEDETRESSEMISRHNRAAVEAISKDKTIDDQFLQKENSDEKLQTQSSASFTRKQGQETRMESKNTEENKAMETLDYNFLNTHTLEDTCLDVENFIRISVSDSGTKSYEDCQTDCSNEVHEEGRAPDVIQQVEPHEKGKKVCLDSLLESEQIKEETETEKAPNLQTSERAFENVQEDHRYEVLTEFKDKEKHLKTALTKLQPEENQSEITTAAGKTINTEVSDEKIKEEQETDKDFQQIYVGERDRTSHQETELRAIENPFKKTNKTFRTISNDSQLDVKSESIEKEEHDNIEDNLPDDTEGKDVTEVATRLTHDNRGAETKIPARRIEVRAQSEKELGVKVDVEINRYQTTKTNEDVQQVPKNPDEETIPDVQPENAKPRRATEISTRVEGTKVEEEYSGHLGEGLTEKSKSIDAEDISLSKALQRSAEESPQEAIHLDEATEVAATTVEAKTQKAEIPQIAETKLDSEKEVGGGTENLKKDPLSGASAMVETKVTDVKVAHKKSHNILSGVGSKVKHSIAKVKKAITGKSSHPKTSSPK